LNDLSHVRAWVFDMDDTLYPRDQGLMSLVQARINAFVVEAVGLEPRRRGCLQRQFLDEHGTTLAGLMANYASIPRTSCTRSTTCRWTGSSPIRAWPNG
jgi:putative hydrolase of the HAD superfamily